jgi:energy-coupling factor transporter ATP-binding protein EcfA2
MSPEKDDELLSEFEKLISDQAYMKAVDFATSPRENGAIEPREHFKYRFFGKDHVFLKALAKAAKSEGDGKAWLDELSLPRWFIKVTDVPKDWYKKNGWYRDYRKNILEAQIRCARHVINNPSLDNSQTGWAELAEQAKFPMGFVYELSHLLKDDEFHGLPGQKLRKIPVVLERGYGAEGQAAYLIIEQLKLGIPSEPYSHPIKMSNIPNSEDFQKAIARAFEYVKRELLMSGDYEKENMPVFRWWVKPAPNEKQIFALEGPSFYGAFACGMLSSARQLNVSQKTAITCSGDEYGKISEIGGLAQKCQAANRQGWHVIIEKDTEKGDNDFNGLDSQPSLLRVKNIEGAMTYISSGIGFEVIDFLGSVYERWGNLPQHEVASDCPYGVDFDEITKPFKVRYMDKNKNTETSHDFKELRRAVIYGWPKVGKTRLFRYIGRKVSDENVKALKAGQLNLETVNIPIILQCTHLADKLEREITFEEALFITLKAEYLIKGQLLSDEFVDLIKEKFVNGKCVLLLDDFSRVNKKVRSNLVDKLNQFARNYPKCRIIITVQQVAKKKKDDYGELPLEITTQSDEAIFELLSPLSDVCPYKGLQYFNDAKYFYGRTALTEKLLYVKKSNFLAVLGNSGSGKSSVVRAGLLHQLGESEQWKICSPITPAWQNQKPLENLAQLFVQPGLSTIDSAAQFDKAYEFIVKRGADGLKRLIAAIEAPRVVLVIDQFEEIFTRCEETERQAFFDCLLGALTNNKLCLVIVMRADFHGKWAKYAELSQKIDANQVTVTDMASDELEQAIIEPAKKVGLGVERELVTHILKDMRSSHGKLPLLQFALEKLWRSKNGNWLTLAEYDKIGGVEGALKNYADQIYQSLSPDEKATAQWIFQGVTQLGEGVEDTRKQISKQDLITEKYPEELLDRTLQKLTDARLVVISVTVIDVAHEILIYQWPRLREWLNKNREFKAWRDRLQPEVKKWQGNNEDKGWLLRDARLVEAEKQLKKRADELTQQQRKYIEKSLALRERKIRLKKVLLLITLLVPLSLIFIHQFLYHFAISSDGFVEIRHGIRELGPFAWRRVETPIDATLIPEERLALLRDGKGFWHRKDKIRLWWSKILPILDEQQRQYYNLLITGHLDKNILDSTDILTPAWRTKLVADSFLIDPTRDINKRINWLWNNLPDIKQIDCSRKASNILNFSLLNLPSDELVTHFAALESFVLSGLADLDRIVDYATRLFGYRLLHSEDYEKTIVEFKAFQKLLQTIPHIKAVYDWSTNDERWCDLPKLVARHSDTQQKLIDILKTINVAEQGDLLYLEQEIALLTLVEIARQGNLSLPAILTVFQIIEADDRGLEGNPSLIEWIGNIAPYKELPEKVKKFLFKELYRSPEEFEFFPLIAFKILARNTMHLSHDEKQRILLRVPWLKKTFNGVHTLAEGLGYLGCAGLSTPNDITYLDEKIKPDITFSTEEDKLGAMVIQANDFETGVALGRIAQNSKLPKEVYERLYLFATNRLNIPDIEQVYKGLAQGKVLTIRKRLAAASSTKARHVEIKIAIAQGRQQIVEQLRDEETEPENKIALGIILLEIEKQTEDRGCY